MAWTEITRRHYRRDDLRYASNLTDDEWSLIKPFLPGAAQLGEAGQGSIGAANGMPAKGVRDRLIFV